MDPDGGIQALKWATPARDRELIVKLDTVASAGVLRGLRRKKNARRGGGRRAS
jgi:hypothetical protein